MFLLNVFSARFVGRFWMVQRFGWLGVLLHVLFWVAVISLIIHLVRRSRLKRAVATNPAPNLGSNVPLDVVKQRYAKGEITKEQYDQFISDLQ
ncbi:MAG TPA: hypothetical protein DEO50_10180 [Erysipelotrichaceae bacterium]|nr:MAG: hypothetical protein A2Y19_02180 [Firmicutes bacterium GWE2_51_13]HBZ42225.1 hypothetical protein [Erysipelotrichaceae bacterium]